MIIEAIRAKGLGTTRDRYLAIGPYSGFLERLGSPSLGSSGLHDSGYEEILVD